MAEEPSELYYVVVNLHRWDGIAAVNAPGLPLDFSGMPGLGYLPVYATKEEAAAAAQDGAQIVLIRVIHKEAPDAPAPH